MSKDLSTYSKETLAQIVANHTDSIIVGGVTVLIKEHKALIASIQSLALEKGVKTVVREIEERFFIKKVKKK